MLSQSTGGKQANVKDSTNKRKEKTPTITGLVLEGISTVTVLIQCYCRASARCLSRRTSGFDLKFVVVFVLAFHEEETSGTTPCFND